MNFNLEKIGGLWKAQSEKSGTYLKGQMELRAKKYTVLVMANKWHEESDNRPDYNLLLQIPEGNGGADKENDFDL